MLRLKKDNFITFSVYKFQHVSTGLSKHNLIVAPEALIICKNTLLSPWCILCSSSLKLVGLDRYTFSNLKPQNIAQPQRKKAQSSILHTGCILTRIY